MFNKPISQTWHLTLLRPFGTIAQWRPPPDAVNSCRKSSPAWSAPAARRLLAEAQARTTPLGRLRVISAEGLIAFKLQGLVNDPRRTQDLEDIRALLKANKGLVNLEEVRGYFRLFDRENLLDESSPSCAEPVPARERATVFFADAGISTPGAAGGDPFTALDDLMTVIEALCPTWPPCEPFGPMEHLRL